MKRLNLRSMALISLRENAAKKILFDPETTVILGNNDTGKSVLIKTIYHTFGADVQFEDNWNAASVISLIEFELDSKIFYILRTKSEIVLFDHKKKLLEKFSSITTELAPFFANFLNFRLRLMDKQNKTLNALPAYCFLPFYIDQDRGWIQSWNSFAGLYQFKGNWKKDLTLFHSGIRPSEYYLVSSKKDDLLQEKEELNDELKILEKMYKMVLKGFGNIEFSLDTEFFKKEIQDLLSTLNKLKEEVQGKKEILKDLYDQKNNIEDQKKIVEKALSEIEKDYEFANKLPEEEISCPTCGATYSNSFVERFSMAKDAGTCQELLIELRESLIEINKKTLVERELFNENSEEIEKMKILLQVKKSKIALKDMIEDEGKKSVIELIKRNKGKIGASMGKILVDLEEIEQKLKKIDSPEKRTKINEEYISNMKNFLKELEVNTFEPERYKRMDCKVNVGGSDLPRALLAYYYSIIDLIKKYSTSTFCPIVIDSPNQQDQDKKSREKMFKFIRDKKPMDSQLILGAVDLEGVEIKGAKIVLDSKEKYHLLSTKKYGETYKELKTFLDQINTE